MNRRYERDELFRILFCTDGNEKKLIMIKMVKLSLL